MGKIRQEMVPSLRATSMVGNPKLADPWALARKRTPGHNCHRRRLSGPAPVDRPFPQWRLSRSHAFNTSFDWNGIRAPYIVATENDCLNGASMLFGYLLTNTAQIFADVRTYWSPESVKRVSGHTLSGAAAGGILHLINSGPATLDGTGQQSLDGKAAMKPFWEITKAEAQKCLDATTWHPSITEYFPGGGWSTRFLTRGGMPVTMCRINLVKGLGPALQIAEGATVDLPSHVHDALDQRTNPTWPTTWFAPHITGHGAFRDCLYGHEQLGRQSRLHQLWPHRRGPDFTGLLAANPGVHAQCSQRPPLPSQRLVRLRHAMPGKPPTIAPAKILERCMRKVPGGSAILSTSRSSN